MGSDWLPAGDLLEVTSERLDSDCWEPREPEDGACEEEEERCFCSSRLFSSSRSVLLSLSVGAFVASFLSRGGEGEDEEEEEELEEEEEDEDRRGCWGASFRRACSFSLSLSLSTSLCLILSRSLSRSLSRESERLLLLLR